MFSIVKRWLAPGSLVGRLMAGTFWSLASSVLNQGGSFASGLVAARLLGQEAFGQFSIVLSTLMSFSLLGQTGLGYSATKFIAEYRSTDTARVERILALGQVLSPCTAIAFSVTLAAAAPWIAVSWLGSERLILPLALGSVFVFFTVVYSYQAGVLAGFERFRELVGPSAVAAGLAVGGVASGAAVGGVGGAVAGLCVAGAARWFLWRRALLTEAETLGIRPATHDWKRELKLVYGFALPATLAGYGMVSSSWYAQALLVRQPRGFTEMADYSAAQSIRLMAMFIPQLVNVVGLSILNNVRRESTGKDYRSVRMMNIVVLTVAAATVALVLAFGSRLLLPLFGPDFAQADPRILWVLLAAAVAESVLIGLFQAVQVSGRMWLSLVAVSLPWQATFAACSTYLVPRLAALGLAVAYFSGVLVALMATAILAMRIDHQPTGSSQYVHS